MTDIEPTVYWISRDISGQPPLKVVHTGVPPCLWCGEPVENPSMDGPLVCPRCDMTPPTSDFRAHFAYCIDHIIETQPEGRYPKFAGPQFFLMCRLNGKPVVPGKLRFVHRYTRAEIRANPQTYFVFGDNLEEAGLGGQAREARGEPNAVGIPTKRAPGRREQDYFTDDDFDEVQEALVRKFVELEYQYLRWGHDVVWPLDGIGTGLAELPTRAPRIHAYIEQWLSSLKATFGESNG